MSTFRVGMIGLGTMGKPMAMNLLDAGFQVVGYNRSREPVEELVEEGGQRAETPRQLAERCDPVVTCLPDTDAVREVLLGEEGVIKGIEDGGVVIDTSTISPAATEEMAEAFDDAGGALLDAPVSGGVQGARNGTLSIMVGGPQAEFAEYRPVFEALGETINYCGSSGAGQVTKACNQIVVSVTMEAISEALVLAQKAGADLESVLDAISDGAAACWALDNRAPQMIRGDFEPGFFAAYQYKDLRIATAAGDDYGVPMPAAGITKEMFGSTVSMGHGREANTAIIKAIERLADAEARIDS